MINYILIVGNGLILVPESVLAPLFIHSLKTAVRAVQSVTEVFYYNYSLSVPVIITNHQISCV